MTRIILAVLFALALTIVTVALVNVVVKLAIYAAVILFAVLMGGFAYILLGHRPKG